MTNSGGARPEGDDLAAYVYDGEDEDAAATSFMRRAEAAFLDREGVVGVGSGIGKSGEDTLLVYVETAEAGNALPARFAGRRVVPQVSGIIRPQDTQ